MISAPGATAEPAVLPFRLTLTGREAQLRALVVEIRSLKPVLL